MKVKLLKRLVPLAASVAMLAITPAMPAWLVGNTAVLAQQEAKDANVYQGKVLGVSKKAKTISISVGSGKNAKTMMVKFDDNTKGVEHAVKNHAAIINFKMVGADKIATDIKAKIAKLPKGTLEMQPEELAALIAKGDTDSYFLADARPAKPFAMGAIPTAVSIPVPKMKESGAKLLPADKNKMVIFYCGGVTCGMSTKNAGMAVKLGYTNVHVMLKGIPGWKKSGNQVVASQDFLTKGNIVLVDLRSKEEYEAGHIARAHNIPLAKLQEANDDMPASEAMPIVLYGNADQAKNGYKVLSKLKRKNVALSPMDFTAWKTAGNNVASGATPAEINWKRKLGANEISIKEFMQVAKTHPANELILDVRTDDEAAAGHLAGSQHIALDQLAGKMSSLPKDKEILVHCTTGARAEMACNELLNAGFKSRYLVAKVECDGTDCDVEE
ncbi:MAG: rhodanese-like domain-containing protein [Desulfobulbaceae bacterium]|nr:rhodanese-like domain-containing protein [Desulfobulbaceae bacterium]